MLGRELEQHLKFMVNLAKKAGEIQMGNYDKAHGPAWEGEHLKVAIEAQIAEMARQEIAERYPSYSIWSEELPELRGNKMRFVIDELDGTNPYHRQFSIHFGCSIGLYEGNTPLAGVVYAPMMREIYVGSSAGAFCNDVPIRVGQTKDVSKAWMTFDGGKYNRTAFIPYLIRALETEKKINGLFDVGCASVTLCLVACGRLDACLYTSLDPEDMAGVVPTLRASGAKVTDLSGEEWQLRTDKSDKKRGEIFAANPVLHEKLSEVLGIPILR